MRLLIVDDEASMCELLDIVFSGEGYTVVTVDSLKKAVGVIEREEPFDAVVCDLKLTDGSGLDVLSRLKTLRSQTAFILITAYASPESAIDALKMGAYDYIPKPFDIEELKQLVRSAVNRKHKDASNQAESPQLPGGEEEYRFIGVSPIMMGIYKTIGIVAPTESTVLITGDSGTGKELVARAIHRASPRKKQPFVSINCGAFPETLLESELFGYSKGAFTGAVNNKRGLFETADGGTLFLDEIAETTPIMQVKLLRVIQEKRLRRLGSTIETPVNVRIISATNRNLQESIQRGLFREDLYYRLAVIPIHLPPLRDRTEDIPALAQYFLERACRKCDKVIRGFSPEAQKIILRREWRGNVRELENAVERAVALETADKIQPEQLTITTIGESQGASTSDLRADDLFITGSVDLEKLVDDYERKIIIVALNRSNGVQTDAARLLGVSYRSLRHRLMRLNLTIEG